MGQAKQLLWVLTEVCRLGLCVSRLICSRSWKGSHTDVINYVANGTGRTVAISAAVPSRHKSTVDVQGWGIAIVDHDCYSAVRPTKSLDSLALSGHLQLWYARWWNSIESLLLCRTFRSATAVDRILRMSIILIMAAVLIERQTQYMSTSGREMSSREKLKDNNADTVTYLSSLVQGPKRTVTTPPCRSSPKILDGLRWWKQRLVDR